MNLKISLIITVFNEEKNILLLLESIKQQTRLPDEIIITDAGSTDTTVDKILSFTQKYNLCIAVLNAPGCRSLGRNVAIKHATHDWIAITDAGCVLDVDWLANLERCQQAHDSVIIAGNQQGLPKTPFEEAVVPYILVMQDAINEQEYLPATRSVLMRKSVWKELGGFDEKLLVSEDFSFFRQAKERHTIHFCREAMISWIPRSSINEFFKMIQSFAKGDVIAGVLRKKVLFLFFRYFLLLCILGTYLLTHNYRMLQIIMLGVAVYVLWSVQKNKKYVANGWYWLPVLQVVADIAVMVGTLRGFTSK